jgi:hypothetical protein
MKMRNEIIEHITKLEDAIIGLAKESNYEAEREDYLVVIQSKTSDDSICLIVEIRLGVISLNAMYGEEGEIWKDIDLFLKILKVAEEYALDVNAGGIFTQNFNEKALALVHYVKNEEYQCMAKELITGAIDQMETRWLDINQLLDHLDNSCLQFSSDHLRVNSYWKQARFYYYGYNGQIFFNWFNGEYEIGYFSDDSDGVIDITRYYAKTKAEMVEVVSNQILTEIKINKRLKTLLDPPAYYFDRVFINIELNLKSNIREALLCKYTDEELENAMWAIYRKYKLDIMSSHTENRVTLYYFKPLDICFVVDGNENNQFYFFDQGENHSCEAKFLELCSFDIENRMKDRLRNFFN